MAACIPPQLSSRPIPSHIGGARWNERHGDECECLPTAVDMGEVENHHRIVTLLDDKHDAYAGLGNQRLRCWWS